MGVFIKGNKTKLFIGSKKVSRGYVGNVKVYSSGNIVTYQVDTGVTYTEEVEEGGGCLSPSTFTPQKTGYTFTGWRLDGSASGDVLSSCVMAGDPITLYAVFQKNITVYYYNGNTTRSTAVKQQYYNNGAIVNPSFALTQATLGGWSPRGWSTQNVGNAAITYANGATFTRDSDITLYGLYYQTITLTTVANGATSRANGTRYFAPAPASYVNPTFTVANPSKSGATFNGWSASAGSTAISNSSISNLTLTASTTRYAVFTYANATSQSTFVFYTGNRGRPYAWTNGLTNVGVGANPDILGLAFDCSKYSGITINVIYGRANGNFKDATAWIDLICGGTTKRLVTSNPNSGVEFKGSFYIPFTQTTGTTTCVLSADAQSSSTVDMDVHSDPYYNPATVTMHGRTTVG